MFKTIKAKLALYKWGFILLTIAALTLTTTIQCHRNSALEDKVAVAEGANKKLTEDLSNLSGNFTEFRNKTDKAIADIDNLRGDIAEATKATESLKNSLRVLPKPTPNGANAKEIQVEANKISEDVFGRFESTMRGN